MKRIAYNILALALMAVFAGFLIFHNTLKISVPVAAEAGSYAESFAKDKGLTLTEVPDTLKNATNLRYETFEYNAVSGGLSLDKYKGIGEEIVIPIQIEGKSVVEIGENFFTNSPSVKKIFVSELGVVFKAEPTKDITITIPSGVYYEEDLKSAGWQVETYNDSETPFFTLGDVPFQYNETDTEIELTSYSGEDKTLLIPAYIDGKPVTAVAFDMLQFELVAFPNTIKSITGTVSELLYAKIFAVELVFTILAFVIVMIVLNVNLPRLRKNNDGLLSGPQVILSFVYLAAQIAFALMAIYKNIVSWPIAIVISTGMLVAYLVLVLMVGTGRKHVQKVSEHVAEKTRDMDILRAMVSHMDEDVSDKEVKKQVTRVIEEIKYCDPMQDDALVEIENRLKETMGQIKAAIAMQDNDTVLKTCDDAMKLLRERKELCKVLK